MAFLMGNQIRVCIAACQNPIYLPTKIKSRMSLHSSTEPGLYLLVKNIIVSHISSRGWLLTVNTELATDVGLLLKLTWGTYTQYWRQSMGLYGPGVTDYVWDGRPMATAVEIF